MLEWLARRLRRVPAAKVLRALFGATVAACLAVASHRGVARADVAGAGVDAWLTAHPKVAAAMVWEFPPFRKIKPVLVRRSVPWPIPEIDPDPFSIPPLSRSVLPEPTTVPSERVMQTSRPLAPRTSIAAAAASLGSLAQPAALQSESVPWPASNQVPPVALEHLPANTGESEYGAQIRSWSKWPEWAKAELRARFATFRDWAQIACPLYGQYAASDFAIKPAGFNDAFSSVVDLDPAPIADPPLNLQPHDPNDPEIPWAMVPSQDAFALYVRIVAAQLAVEIAPCLPWSLTDEAAADLRVLLDGRRTFRYVPAGPSEWGEMTATGHLVATTVTPAPPLVVLGFLAQNALIGGDRTETVVRFLEWERTHLRHVIGGTPVVPLGSGLGYWGYNGRPPVSRMINGTVMAAPLQQSGGGAFFDAEVRHWVGGCGGAAGFNEQVLRVVNVAAEKTAYAHFQSRFSLDDGVHAGIGHGDDPYGLGSAPEIPLDEILIDDATFHAWFVDEPDPDVKKKYVSRRGADLYLEYLPEVLLRLHCKDTLWFANDHASSLVYGWAFSSTYSVAEVEAMGLWTGIEAKLATLGGCSALGF